MERYRLLLFVGMLLFFGSIGLNRFSSPSVRAVDALGLFASGMGCGAALCGFILTLMASKGMVQIRKRPRAGSQPVAAEQKTGDPGVE